MIIGETPIGCCMMPSWRGSVRWSGGQVDWWIGFRFLDFQTLTLPETNSHFAPENKGFPKGSRIIFQPSIFRGELLVSGRIMNPGGVILKENSHMIEAISILTTYIDIKIHVTQSIKWDHHHVSQYSRKHKSKIITPKVSDAQNGGTAPYKAILGVGFSLHKPFIQLI